MLREEIKNIKSEKRDLRNFGLVMGIFLGVLGGLLWWKGRDTHPYFLIGSTIFLVFGFAVPTLLKPLQRIWMTFAVILGCFMTRLILGILFYLVFTFIGVCTKLLGNRLLDLEIDKSIKSYWNKREHVFSKNNYEKQF